jgi:hypothetical protein
LLGMPFSNEFYQDLTALPGPRIDEGRAKVIYAFSKDSPDVEGVTTTLRLPDPGFWARVSWLTTPWNPAASINAIVEQLRTSLQ